MHHALRRVAGVAVLSFSFFFAGCASSSPPEAPAAQTQTALTTNAIAIPWLPDSVRKWSADLEAAGAHHGVDPELLAIIVLVESRGDPDAVSPGGSVGLMQVMPATAHALATAGGLPDPTPEKLRDPAYNLDLGAAYIAEQLKTFGAENVELAAAAYNGGPDAVKASLAGGAPLSDETTHYEARVAELWAARHSTTFALSR